MGVEGNFKSEKMFNFLDTLFGSFNLLGAPIESIHFLDECDAESTESELITSKKTEDMKSNLAVDFSVDKDNRTITIKREFEAERALVWDAYTKPEILDQWWAPKPWKAKTKSMDFRDGGKWLYAMVGPNGEEHWSIVDYTKINAKQSFSGLDAFTDENGKINKEMPRSSWEVSFDEQGNHTFVQIIVSYDDLAQLEATIEMGFKEGLLSAMENLDELLPKL
jgi:uncharacterized protein YndB with AHSA1/START domain